VSLWAELKRRNVVKVAIAYLAAIWLVVQVAAIVLPAFEIPGWTMRGVLILAAVGFVLTVVLAWIYDLTPEGVRRTDDLPASARAGLGGRKLDFAIIGLLSLALVAVAFDRYWLGDGSDGIDAFFGDATLELVSDFPGAHSEPALSPDGTMIAFVSDASGSSQIWAKDLARGEPIRITDVDFAVSSPTWSPRNDQILFQGGARAATSSIYSVGPLGTPVPRILVERGVAPSFGGDGRHFVYAFGREIWIADADGGNQRRIENLPESPGFAPRDPSLSPDGSLVAFVHGEAGPAGDIWIIPAAGGEARRLTDHSSTTFAASSPSWTADGRHIVYSAGGLGSRHLWRVGVEDGEAAPLTTGTGGYDSPLMSADGKTLAYTSRRPVWKLMRSDTATGNHTELHESRNPILLPQVSPNGDEIVFFTQIATGLHVFTIGIDGGNLRQLTFDGGGINTLPTWSDTGDAVYYYRAESLHRVPREGGPTAEVLPDFHWSSRNWLAVHGSRLAYHEFGIEPDVRRAVIRDLDSGAERDLPLPVVRDMKWSRDGSEIIGRLPNLAIVICSVEDLVCDTVMDAENPVRGEHPRWSSDESRIFLQRGVIGRAEHRSLWVVDRDGQNLMTVLEYGPIGDDTDITVGRNDDLVWNLADRGTDEIWVARRP
jgi:Tol biopolymer transport system component